MINKLSLSGIWRFCPDPEDQGITQNYMIQENQPYLGEKIRCVVPSCWNRKTNPLFKNYNGIAWYWRVFTIPSNFNNKMIFLRFERILHEAKIYVDGELIGQFHGGFIPFEINISNYFDKKEHFLAVRIDGRAQSNRYSKIQDVEEFLGIVGDVSIISKELIVLDEFNLNPHLFYKDNDPSRGVNYAELEFSFYFKNLSELDYSGSIKIDLCRDYVSVVSIERPVDIIKNNTRMTKILMQINHEDLDLWSPENPNYYNLSIQVGNESGNVIEIDEITGIREIKIEESGLFLNGISYSLKGYDFEIDDPSFGYVLPETFIIDKLSKLKEIKINAIRPNQGIFSPIIIEWATRLGFIVIEDVPVVELNPTEKQQFFNEYVYSVIYQPALAFWSVNRKNEFSNPKLIKIISDLQSLFTNKLDKTRQFVPQGNFGANSWIVQTKEGFINILKED